MAACTASPHFRCGTPITAAAATAGWSPNPCSTDGGGLCSNHPSNRGGMTKLVEAVRQLRGEAHPAVQVPNCGLALASGPGGVIGSGHAHATVVLGRE